MCRHSEIAEKAIRELVQELYPAIERQLILVSAGNLSAAGDYPRLTDLLQDIRNEFRGLVAYETRQVFPVLLKIFSHTESEFLQPLPDIRDLQLCTRNKEMRLLSLVNEMAAEAELAGIDHSDPARKLFMLFQKDFTEKKLQWNRIVSTWSKTCKCMYSLHTENKSYT